MNKNLLIVLGLGALAYYVWYMNKQKNTGIKLEDIENNDELVNEIVKRATERERSKYTNAFRQQYNIKLPAIQASKEVKKAAFDMQDERYAKQVDRQLEKPEVYL
jgi:hypothetical protein